MNTLDRKIQAAAASPVPWTELQARRVWNNVERLREEPNAAGHGRGWVWVGASAMATVAAVIALVVAWPDAGGPVDVEAVAAVDGPLDTQVEQNGEAPPTVTKSGNNPQITGDANDPSTDELPAPVVRIAEHATARLSPDADLDVAERSATPRVTQRAGEVLYAMEPSARSTLSVTVDNIEFTADDASFWLDTDPETVEVRVVVGRVHVRYGGDQAKLGPGESLRLARTRLTPPDESGSPTTSRREDRPPKLSADELLGRADNSRRSGDLNGAAKALRQFVRGFKAHPQLAAAWFQLGKVERQRGHHRSAARAFAASRKAGPRGILAGDALAEQARSLLDAGRTSEARQQAEAYLRQYANGVHASKMRQIAASVR